MYKTQGIIIKTINSGEYDKLITVYTRDFGKLILKGKALRKNQSKLRGHLNLFLYSHLMIASGRGYDVIAGAETIKSFSNLRADLEKLSAAYYFSELIDKLIVAPEKDNQLWQLIEKAFQDLNQPKVLVKQQIQELENNLLICLGYDPKQTNLKVLLNQFSDQDLVKNSFYKSLVF